MSYSLYFCNDWGRPAPEAQPAGGLSGLGAKPIRGVAPIASARNHWWGREANAHCNCRSRRSRLFSGAINAAENGGDTEAGKLKASLCERYHLKKGQGLGPNPALAGQTLEYLVYALNAYKSGQRQNPSMNGIAKTE
jgi:cytochrome c553